jgi:hypothetical protein
MVQKVYINHTNFINTLYQPVFIGFYNQGELSKLVNIKALDSVVSIDKGEPYPAFLFSDSVVLSFGDYKKIDKNCGRLPIGEDKTACFSDSANLLDLMQYTATLVERKNIVYSRYVIGTKDSLEAVNGQ